MGLLRDIVDGIRYKCGGQTMSYPPLPNKAELIAALRKQDPELAEKMEEIFEDRGTVGISPCLRSLMMISCKNENGVMYGVF